ncbi:hypothetical protein [Nocardia sp. NPDC052112]|uniref:hypothetical protein n=1 Tax=Nocardia sp. NPDC052112 TaxID=3155646 RepID=UPI00342F75D4
MPILEFEVEEVTVIFEFSDDPDDGVHSGGFGGGTGAGNAVAVGGGSGADGGGSAPPPTPRVMVFRPGTKIAQGEGGFGTWRFSAEVNGRVGLISCIAKSEADAADCCKRALETNPDLIQGIS